MGGHKWGVQLMGGTYGGVFVMKGAQRGSWGRILLMGGDRNWNEGVGLTGGRKWGVGGQKWGGSF